ncbi:MAG: methylglutaconyl-CoA hydratase [Flavobacteriales bacterium]|nr:methylglutaconyl-CoA hydratase [Flavobacteriales bacterium]|tara:strand:+ start:2451 stop:3230 length:780 start_codon:yes stop_codon:yes gene_type:complete
MKDKLVTYHCENRIGFITMIRAEKRNALNPQLIEELKIAFGTAEKDEKCKVIVLQAKGQAFCAGADLKYLQSLQSFSHQENVSDSSSLMQLFKQIYTLEKIVIAKIQGYAIAGGCGLASVCDLSIASDEAKLSYSEVKIGFIPAIVSVFLLRKIGESKTKELLLSGKTLSAKEAVSVGLINQVVSNDILDDTVQNIAEKLCHQASGQSLATTKKLIANLQNMSLEDGLYFAVQENAKARLNEDCKKGISSFLNKEKINW